MAAGIESQRCFHAARAATHDDVTSGRACARAATPIFERRLRVDRTSSALADVDAADARIAVDAGPDRLRRALGQLARQVRVGQEFPPHAEEVECAGGDLRLGHVRFHAPGGDHRDGNGPLDGFCGRQVPARDVRDVGFGMQLELAHVVVRGHGHRICARRFDHLRRPHRERQLDAVRRAELLRVELDPDGEIGADRCANSADHFEQQAGAVLQRATVCIGTPVRPRGEEAREQVSVPAVYFDAVRPGAPGSIRRIRVLPHHQLDVFLGHFLVGDRPLARPGRRQQLALHERVGHLLVIRVDLRNRRTPHRMAVEQCESSAEAALVELHRELRAVCVDCVGQSLQPGDVAVVRDRDLVLLHRAYGPCHPTHATDDQRGPPFRLLLVISQQLLAHGAVLFGKADPHRHDDHPVAQLQLADAAGRQQVRVFPLAHLVFTLTGRRHPPLVA